jgi:transcription elongation factor Elf1
MFKQYTCPKCRKYTYGMTEDYRKAVCSNCGYYVNYEQVPFLKDIVKLIRDVKKASGFVHDANDLELRDE